MRFTVGPNLKGKPEHLVVVAEDALIAGLRSKMGRPEALIKYIRPKNRRGDARHPALKGSENTP